MLFPALGLAWGADSDGDGYDGSTDDCDDAVATIHPDAQEVLGDGTDQDCDGDDAVMRSVIETTFPSTIWSTVGTATLGGGERDGRIERVRGRWPHRTKLLADDSDREGPRTSRRGDEFVGVPVPSVQL